MPQIVDLTLLRQVTRDAMSVYEANIRAEDVFQEGQHAVAQAEYLLSTVTGVYLAKEILFSGLGGRELTREEMVKDFIEIQTAYALFKESLYLLLEARISAKDWQNAAHTWKVLADLEPNYRDLQELKERLDRGATTQDYTSQIEVEIQNKNYRRALEILLTSIGESEKVDADNESVEMIDKIQRAAAEKMAEDIQSKVVPLLQNQVFIYNSSKSDSFMEELRIEWNKALTRHDKVGNGSLLAKMPRYHLASIEIRGTNIRGTLFRCWLPTIILLYGRNDTVLGYIVEAKISQ